MATCEIPVFADDATHVHVVVDAPRGFRFTYRFDDSTGVLVLHESLRRASFLPLDFGFVPGTCGADGDPLDALVIAEEPTLLGCVVPSRLVGILDIELTHAGMTTRSDCLVTIAQAATSWTHVHSIGDMDARWLDDLELFVRAYHEPRDLDVVVVGRGGSDRARERLAWGIQARATQPG